MISRPSVCKWRIRKKGTGFSLPALFDIIPIDVMFHLTWCSVKIRELEKNKHVSLCNIYAASKYYTLKPKCRFYFGCVSIYTTYRRNNYTHRHTQRPFLVLLWQKVFAVVGNNKSPVGVYINKQTRSAPKKRKRRVKTDSATSSIDVCQLIADVLA